MSTQPLAHPADFAAPISRSREEEFRALYTADFPSLAGYLLSLVGNEQTAREFAQEAFTRLFARWFGVREPRAYVYYVATNLARDHWRRSKRERELVSSIGYGTEHASLEHDPWLRDLVERLPEHHREAVLLHYYADLPVSEVAALLRRPVGTIKRRLFEARALLLTAMEGHRD
ncbi:MAG: RNA polymerase sigma factor [Mycobacteriales bacterium]|nr:RNA polymerase sigma factor [Frankia sp.]